VTPAGAGAYMVTVTDQNGCTASSAVTVVVHSTSPAIASSNSPVCVNGQINLQVSGGVTYSWSGPQNFQSSVQNPNIPNANGAMSGMYHVTITDQNGCSQVTSTNVLVAGTSSVNIQSNSPVCEGNDIRLVASGGNSFVWNGPNGFYSQNQNITIAGAIAAHAGAYTLTVTNLSGCSASMSVTVVVQPSPEALIEGDTVVCQGQSVTLSTASRGDLLWDNNSTNTSIEVTPLQSHRYRLIVTQQNCRDTAYHAVTVRPQPAVVISADKTNLNSGESAQLTVSGAEMYEWHENAHLSCMQCHNPIARPLSTETYCVQGFTNGCVQDTCITIYIHDACDIALANVFSPNGDGINDTWCSIQKDCISHQDLRVFDRWGNLLHTSSGPALCWNPTGDHLELQTQVVTYILRVVMTNGEVQKISGDITILK
jgi:gliding motility-associated-like protein